MATSDCHMNLLWMYVDLLIYVGLHVGYQDSLLFQHERRTPEINSCAPRPWVFRGFGGLWFTDY